MGTLSITDVTQDYQQIKKIGNFKNDREIDMELKILGALFEELKGKSVELESSRKYMNNNEWISLYKEIYNTILIVEKGVYKRKIMIAVKSMRSIKNSILTLFERSDSITRAIQLVEQKSDSKMSNENEKNIKPELSPITDISKELQETKERLKKLLESAEQRNIKR